MTQLGIYVGNSTAALTDFENWLGRDVTGVHTAIGFQSWGDFLGSTALVADMFHETQRELHWSVPLITVDSSLAVAATGAYNDYYRQAAETILQAGPTDVPINIRVGWELNGDWFPWSAIGHEQEYIGAFRQFVDTFRSVSDRFVFEWNVNEAWAGIDPATAYPGNDYVDIIGMDVYWNTAYWGEDPYYAWQNLLTQQFGMQWHQDFADAMGKPTAYSEWGVMTDNAAPYINAMKMWFDTHDVVFQSRWDSDDDYLGKMSDGTQPNSGNAYISAFQNPNAEWKLNGLQYIASYGDLIDAFGANAEAGVRHYFQYGVVERREPVTFDANTYLANYGDLRDAFGWDQDAAATHWIIFGRHEGRTDDPLF
ncbi:glycosyl hydrolase [Roseomonas sp. KE0001]|uniref:glycosyl hydrolase n=1 Tax=unclassified Roseomonas TaxID=2617492 RepID=UPI0018DF27A7|nr:glycosyl hydrolase [Roseomonas sp. KE0001]MBI0433541.1 glycosidase [Roseomonas sp. KE0001]